MNLAFRKNSTSPSLRLIEFRIGLPGEWRKPTSRISHLELSIISGTLAMSASCATRLRKVLMAAAPSSIPSSMLTSMTFAPPSTCVLATRIASSNLPSLMRRANLREPVTLVRSPIMTNGFSLRNTNGSFPANCVILLGSGFLRGVSPCTASPIALIWAGVLPQQPPTMLTQPCFAKSRTKLAILFGVSSNSPSSLGSPAFG